jgi:signal transduction histidine kinase
LRRWDRADSGAANSFLVPHACLLSTVAKAFAGVVLGLSLLTMAEPAGAEARADVVIVVPTPGHTERVVVIGGTSDTDHALLDDVRTSLSPWSSRLTLAPREILATISAASSAPVYGLYDPYIGRGAVGGRVMRLEDVGDKAGALGRAILTAGVGTPLPPPRDVPTVTMVDWRQLRRWGLDEARLPAGGIVLSRGKAFWDEYASTLALTAVAVVEAALIAVLLLQWRRRRAAERSLTERLRFEEVISKLYARFVHSRGGDLDGDAIRGLGDVSELLGVDRATLILPAAHRDSFRVRSWVRPGIEPAPSTVTVGQFPWTAERLRRGEPVRFVNPGELPAEAAVDRQSFQEIGARSHVGIPLVAEDTVLGSISFTTVRSERPWADELVQRLTWLAEVFANVVALRRSDDKLQQSRALSVAIVDSLPGRVVVINRAGRIVATNDWARRTGAPPHPDLAIGADYLALWRGAVAAGDRAAADVLAGIDSVLDGTRAGFSIEYQDAATKRWFEFHVHALRTASGGAVISRLNIDDRKRADAEARQVREQLARFGRVATVGQLTAALAHEVKQPLTGILTNAQAAQRLLAAPQPDLGEFRAILDDIIADDQRASTVLQRLRGMLKRREPAPAPVTIDLNRVIQDVVRFLHTDAVIRNATVVCDLQSDLPAIQGDVVQLQQVLVNLVLNGLDAMRGVPVEHRRLRIASELAGDMLVVSVRDAGVGITEHAGRIFDPFYTTKTEGMGMGLPIARTIVEAHGGRLWASDNAEGGATFWFALPVVGVGPTDEPSGRPTVNSAERS